MKADGFQLPAGVKKALAPAAAALSIAAPAFAEGTGEVTFAYVFTAIFQLKGLHVFGIQTLRDCSGWTQC